MYNETIINHCVRAQRYINIQMHTKACFKIYSTDAQLFSSPK